MTQRMLKKVLWAAITFRMIQELFSVMTEGCDVKSQCMQTKWQQSDIVFLQCHLMCAFNVFSMQNEHVTWVCSAEMLTLRFFVLFMVDDLGEKEIFLCIVFIHQNVSSHDILKFEWKPLPSCRPSMDFDFCHFIPLVPIHGLG